MTNEQKLVDMMYEVAMLSAEFNHNKGNAEIAKWVTDQLQLCGFKGREVGACWFKLEE